LRAQGPAKSNIEIPGIFNVPEHYGFRLGIVGIVFSGKALPHHLLGDADMALTTGAKNQRRQ